MAAMNPAHPEDPNQLVYEKRKFSEAVAFVLYSEGDKLSLDPQDPGGKTKWGISERYDEVDPTSLTKVDAERIFYKNYWIPICGSNLGPAISMAVLDFAVHSGVARAGVLLQKMVGTKQDGIIGPKTLNAVVDQLGTMMIDGGGISYQEVDVTFAVAFTEERMAWICRIVKSQPKTRLKYLVGWMRRVFRLQKKLMEYYAT